MLSIAKHLNCTFDHMPRGLRFFTYIVTNKSNGVLYTGFCNDLERRMREHKSGLIKGFTQQYNCKKLVWFEYAFNPESSIAREKQIKGWKREKKIALIEEMNPTWEDLAKDWR